MAHTRRFQENDVVRFTRRYLRDTGQFTGVPVNGRVFYAEGSMGDRPLVTVEWCNGNVQRCLESILEPCPRTQVPALGKVGSNFQLVDDGTLDTVVRDSASGKEYRFDCDHAALFREHDGTLDFPTFLSEMYADGYLE